MKFETDREPEKFNPVAITITFESQEEVDAAYMLGYMNRSIPDKIRERFGKQFNVKVSKALREIQTGLVVELNSHNKVE